MKKLFLLLIFCSCFFLQGYSYQYHVPVINGENNAANRNNAGIMYMEMGQYQAAMAEFKIAISLSPDSPASAAYYNNLGLLYVKLNQQKQAEECFSQAVKLNPVFLEYHKNLMSIQAKSDKADASLNQALTQIKADENNSSAYFTAGLIYAQKGQNEEAVKYLKKYTSLEKGNIMSNAVKNMIKELEKK